MDDLRVNDRLTIPGAELEERFARAGGPGGQHEGIYDADARFIPMSAVVVLGDQTAAIAGRCGEVTFKIERCTFHIAPSLGANEQMRCKL